MYFFKMCKLSLFLLKLFSVLCLGAKVKDADGFAEHSNRLEPTATDVFEKTELIMSFVVFRHGDRTPDEEELELFYQPDIDPTFYPYGPKALTNEGKIRAFNVGAFLRKRYDGWLSRIYSSDDILVRTTEYDRTKMTALTALAALYPPEQLQRWNDFLAWQPIPYDVKPFAEDDFMYYYTCPRYLQAREEVYNFPEVKSRIDDYADLFEELTVGTGKLISTPEDVFYLDNLLQTEQNVGISPPAWIRPLMPRIKEMTKFEYKLEYYTDEMIRLSGGVLLNEILNASSEAIKSGKPQHKIRLYSGHENNVAALMAAARVFEPHQPPYGATFALELRRNLLTGLYGFSAVYTPVTGGPTVVLPIKGSQDPIMCEFELFRKLTSNFLLSRNEFLSICRNE